MTGGISELIITSITKLFLMSNNIWGVNIIPIYALKYVIYSSISLVISKALLISETFKMKLMKSINCATSLILIYFSFSYEVYTSILACTWHLTWDGCSSAQYNFFLVSNLQLDNFFGGHLVIDILWRPKSSLWTLVFVHCWKHNNKNWTSQYTFNKCFEDEDEFL